MPAEYLPRRFLPQKNSGSDNRNFILIFFKAHTAEITKHQQKAPNQPKNSSEQPGQQNKNDTADKNFQDRQIISVFI